MTKPLLIHFPMLGEWSINVEVVRHIEKAMQRYKNEFEIEEYTEEDTDALTVHGEGTCYVFLRPRASPGTIAHESWHALTGIFETLGIELDHESMAYHLGYVVDKIYKYVRRRGK